MEGLIFGILRYLTIPWWEIVAGTYEPCKAHSAERKSRRLWTRDTRFFTPMNSGTCSIRKCISPKITLKRVEKYRKKPAGGEPKTIRSSTFSYTTGRTALFGSPKHASAIQVSDKWPR